MEGTLLEDKTSYNEAGPYTGGSTFYITAAWGEEDIYNGAVPPLLTVGDRSVFTVTTPTNVNYVNQPLKSDTKYSIFTRYDIMNDADDSMVSSSHME